MLSSSDNLAFESLKPRRRRRDAQRDDFHVLDRAIMTFPFQSMDVPLKRGRLTVYLKGNFKTFRHKEHFVVQRVSVIISFFRRYPKTVIEEIPSTKRRLYFVQFISRRDGRDAQSIRVLVID